MAKRTAPQKTSQSGETAEHLRLGRIGEDAACRALHQAGYRVLRRNWTQANGRNELDIIAEDRGVIVFVEVKTRGPSALRSPESAVDSDKQRRIKRAAAAYLRRYRQPAPHRFDIISVVADDTMQVVGTEILRGAFE